jgi:hypothetical protein
MGKKSPYVHLVGTAVLNLKKKNASNNWFKNERCKVECAWNMCQVIT